MANRPASEKSVESAQPTMQWPLPDQTPDRESKVNWYKLKALAMRMKNGLSLRSGSMIAPFGITAQEARHRIGEGATDLERLFLDTQSPSVVKWLQYLPLYDRYFTAWRGKPVRMLEIGIFNGGSMALWRNYFGAEATIWGIDINPECAARVKAPNVARIGSQADPDFLRRTVAEMGGVDVILDDGSHIASHQRTSFETLFPLLTEGGLYVIEDLHTAYWPDIFEGGYRRPGTAIEQAKRLIDDMHHWYHPNGFSTAAKDMVTGVHFHDSIVFIDKAKQARPAFAKIGEDTESVRIFPGDRLTMKRPPD